MASKKSKSSAVSASSFLELRAEIARHEEDFVRNKAGGKAPVGGPNKPEKKKPVWARQNQGVSARAARDVELEAISRPTLESARAALERKAKIYDKLKKGKSGGLSEAQYDALLVDFDNKEGERYGSDSDDVDESLSVPTAPIPPGEDTMVDYIDEFGRTRTGLKSEVPSHLQPSVPTDDDPLIEYEDEFGRMRTARRSEVPRQFLQQTDVIPEDDPTVMYNPVHHFPVYQPDAERVAAVAAELAEANKPLNQHYDAAREVRAKGAGFYQFSGDAETRARQMEELATARKTTEKTRHEVGAVDLRPGEVEGLVRDEEDGTTSQSQAMAKRKRDIEERRKALDAKRRKVKGVPPSEETLPVPSVAPLPSAASSVDPFAALEVQTSTPGTSSTMSQADEFLKQLEKDMGRRRS